MQQRFIEKNSKGITENPHWYELLHITKLSAILMSHFVVGPTHICRLDALSATLARQILSLHILMRTRTLDNK